MVRRARLRWVSVTTLVAGVCAVAATAAALTHPSGDAARPSVRTPANFVVRSFDGTSLTGHAFAAPGATARHPAPTVLYGPSWGGAALASASIETSGGSGKIGVAPLLAAGYNVVSWNPRGFHSSGGRAEFDQPRYEGRDVSAILDWVAAQPWAKLDRPEDPRVGMVGGSYGGGVQWAAAATDRRIDAIVPDIAWHSLASSLAPHGTAKSGWATLLARGAAAAGQRGDPRLNRVFHDARTSFRLPAVDAGFLASAGPGRSVSRVRAPALILQGTVDTLFPLREAVADHAALASHGVPVKMVWFCGGHGVCPTRVDNTAVIQRDTLAWLARYVKRQPVSTGAGLEWVDQRGGWHAAAAYRAGASPVVARGSGDLPLLATGGSGPYAGLPAADRRHRTSVLATPATNAVNVPIRFTRDVSVLGAPQLSMAYRGTAPDSDGRVLAQIVDDSTHAVLGSQITPIPVRLDGRSHTVSVPLEYLATVATAGDTFTLQLVADSAQFDTHPTGGSIRFSDIRIALPSTADPTAMLTDGATGRAQRDSSGQQRAPFGDFAGRGGS